MKNAIDKILKNTLILLLFAMLIFVVWQVFARYVLGSPSTITDELSSFALIWLGLLGAAYATGQRLHLAIDLIPESVVKGNRLLFETIVKGGAFVFALLVMVIGGARLCLLTFQFDQTSAALGIPLGVIYLVVPASGLLICYYSAYLFYQDAVIKKG